MAPRAQWIAAKGCESNFCTESSLLASGQWVVAPTRTDGTDPDPAMAPDIVNNSWGGPACGTAGSPGDNIPAYGVGAYDINNNIASFSSRGPSGVDPNEIKPNASAPGVSVRSSVNGGGYSNFSGTSMARPHAAGTVALVWSAAPALRGERGYTAVPSAHYPSGQRSQVAGLRGERAAAGRTAAPSRTARTGRRGRAG